MKDSKDFPLPLNTFIEEEVEVATMVPRVNEKEKRVVITAVRSWLRSRTVSRAPSRSMS